MQTSKHAQETRRKENSGRYEEYFENNKTKQQPAMQKREKRKARRKPTGAAPKREVRQSKDIDSH